MKKSIQLAVFTVLSALALSANAELVRGVKVVEGKVAKMYIGNQYGDLLYTFDLDKGVKSVCDGDCAEKWPPFIIDPMEAKVLKAPLATSVRANGLLQLTIDGKPVYTYYLNRVEGDDLGDGVGGVWHDIDFK